MNEAPHLDSMLDAPAAAKWLQLTERDLAAKSRGRNAKIPAFRMGHRTVRYHPRTIITKLARETGLPMEFIAASFGLNEKPKGETAS